MGLYPPIVHVEPDSLVRRLYTNQWYVDATNGDNDSDGNRPEKPLETIAEAVDRSTNGNMDVINVVEPGHVAEATPIVLNKSFLTVRGWPSQSPFGHSPCTLVAPTDTAYFTIAAQDVCVRDFTIHGGASWPVINYSPVAWSFRTVVHNVTFNSGTWGIAQGGLTAATFVADAPSHNWSISDCKFMAGLSLGGVFLMSNGSWGVIADNFFDTCANAIYANIDCQSQRVQCVRNRILVPSDDQVGRGIYIGTNAGGWFVADNDANDMIPTTITNNPYFDQANLSAWFRNVAGGAGFTELPPA